MTSASLRPLNSNVMFNKTMHKILSISFIALAPISAFASGGQIISLFWYQLLLFAVVLFMTFIIKLPNKHKVISFFLYLSGVLIGFIAIADMRAGDIFIIISISLSFPAVFWLLGIAVFMYTNKHNKALVRDAGEKPPAPHS